MKKGFTLVELAVVLLIIGILAGVILRNIGSQPIQARDTKRLAVLRNVSLYLTQYFSKVGNYPTQALDQGNESSFVQELQNQGILPPGSSDLGFPSPTNWSYSPCTDGNYTANHFIFKVIMEQTKTQAPELYKDSYKQSGPPTEWRCDSSFGCDGNRDYCLIQ